MDLNDAERYAVAALFTLALHSTNVEAGVDQHGNSLSESDIAWGCPSEELFDEYLLSQEPLRLPPELQDLFWGYDCMAHTGLAPRLYAWLKVPRRAWPGLLRMPDIAGSAGSPEAVEAFVALVRRYSAFLDPELAFTTGQASRLQQHFSMPAATAAAHDAEQQQQQYAEELDAADASHLPAAAGAAAGASGSTGTDAVDAAASSSSSSSLFSSLDFLRASKVGSADEGSHKAGANAVVSPQQPGALSSVPAAEAVAAAAASVTAAALAASRESSLAGADPVATAGAAPGHAATESSSSTSNKQQAGDTPSHAAAAPAAAAAAGPAAGGAHASQSSAQAFDELRAAVDQLPRTADEGTVVPAATFTPSEYYEHSTSHKAVLALYEIIGGCLSSNTESIMEPFVSAAAKEPETAAAAATAAAARKQASSGGLERTNSTAAGSTSGTSSTSQPSAIQAVPSGGAAGSSGSSHGLTSRPSAAWFPAEDDAGEDDQTEVGCDATAARAGSGSSSSAAAGSKQQAKDPDHSQQQQQQQQLQGLAAVQWYDARARVAVKRVAHWLRVPWPQVRAFEQMWAAQALSVDPSAQPKYSTGSKAMQYLKVGAAAVGGGALLAVTGGLAAPAIAAGLGAAVTLAHGGAAAAAAVAGFAGSTAGTAAVTSLFGAWGASTAGGSAGQLFGDVKEFGFWDLSGSIYTDGRLLPEKEAAKEADPAAAAGAAAAEATQQEGGAAGKAATAALGPAEQSAAGDTAAAGDVKAAVMPVTAGVEQKPVQDEQQQQPSKGFLHRLFSPKPTGTSSSSAQQTAAAAAAAAGTEAAGRVKEPVGSSSSNPTSSSQSPSSNKQQQQDDFFLLQQEQPRQPRSPSPRVCWARQQAVVGEDDGGEIQQAAFRTRFISLQDDAFSDAYSDEEGEHQQQQQVQQGQQQPEQHSGALLQPQPAQEQQVKQQATAGDAQALTQAAQNNLQPPLQQQRQQQEQGTHQQPAASNSKSTPASAAGDGAKGAAAEASAVVVAASSPTKGAAANSPKADAVASGGSPKTTAAGPSRWFTRQAAPPPVYVPLLQTPVNPKHQAETRIALTIAVNGCCISSMEDYARPWLHLPSRDCDRFALVWESACLKELGGALVSFIAQQALTQVTQKTIQTFLFTGLVGALALPMTLTTAMKVAFGSKWLVALRRAQAAGKMMAMQLAQGCHGGRPVTLIGCSMGARLIFHALLELSRLGAHGCVENVILLGAPLSCRPDRWCIARSVVAGRLINGYSVNDWTLGLLYRVHSSSSIWLQAAGIWKIDVPGVENVNLSRLVNGHSDYLTAMDEILEVINMHDA